MSQKSQSAVEFIILASFMLLVAIGFFAVNSSRVLQAKEEGNKKIAEDIAGLAYREIEIAKSVNDGYARTFVMPQAVNGINYSISITDNRELLVNYLGNEYIKFLQSNVTGNISTGINQITKINGIIYINGSSVQLPQSLLNFLIMRNNLFNVISFDNSGNVILKGNLQQNHPNPPASGNDEFIVKDRNGNNVAVINLNNGNMFIKGSLQQNQATLTPSPSNNNFIVKDSNGNVIAYIDEAGNFLLKGTLTQNGNP